MRARLPYPEAEAQNRNGASRPTPRDSRAFQLRIPGELNSWATTVAAHLNQSLSEFVLQADTLARLPGASVGLSRTALAARRRGAPRWLLAPKRRPMPSDPLRMYAPPGPRAQGCLGCDPATPACPLHPSAQYDCLRWLVTAG